MSSSQRFRRRALLGAGLGAGLASMFLRQLEARAQSGPPKRLLLVHKPCGTILERFFPTAGGETDFTLGPITAAFEPLKSDMVIFDNVTASRQDEWQGDRHGAGLICMTTGSRAIEDGIVPVDNDEQFHNITAASPSVDQLLLQSSALADGLPQGAPGSVHLAAYRDSVKNGRLFPANGAANFRVVSFSGAKMPIFPEVRPDVAVQNVFGSVVQGGAEEIARQQLLNKSIMDLIGKDLGKLRGVAPASELPRLDANLAAIEQLEGQLTSTVAASCQRPQAEPLMSEIPPGTPSGLRIDAIDHQQLAKTQLNIIKTAFQCDLIRAATFSYGHGNSDIQFTNLVPALNGNTAAFHEVSHLTDSPSLDFLAAIDAYYSQQFAEFLLDLKNTPEGDSNMLDNTLVVYFSDVSIGHNHASRRMPVIFFGGKSLGLQQGRWLDMKGRFMNDIWASTLDAFGYQLPADNKFAGHDVWKGVTGPRLGEGAVSGIFGA